MNPTIELLKSHRSIRNFKDTPVEARIVKTLIETAQCAATSNHVQAYTVIHVKNMQIRHEIAELSGPQVWVEQAPVFLVFCADLNRLERACSMHGKKMARGYAEQFIVATVDTALLAQNTIVAAESMGLGGVFIGGIRNDPQKISDLLHIPDKAYPVFGLCLGYPDHDPPVKPRLPVETILKTDRYGQENDDERLQNYDVIMNSYYKTRDSHQKDQTWSGQIAAFMSKVIRPHMKSFLQKRGFFLK